MKLGCSLGLVALIWGGGRVSAFAQDAPQWFENAFKTKYGGNITYNLNTIIQAGQESSPLDGDDREALEFSGYAVSRDGVAGFYRQKGGDSWSIEAIEFQAGGLCSPPDATAIDFEGCLYPFSHVNHKYTFSPNRPFSLSGNYVSGAYAVISRNTSEAIALLSLQNYLRRIPSTSEKSSRQQYKDHLIALAKQNRKKKFFGQRCNNLCLVMPEEMGWALRQLDIDIDQEIELIYPPRSVDYKNRRRWANSSWEWLPQIPGIKNTVPKPTPWLNAEVPENLKGCITSTHKSLKRLKTIHVITYGVAHLDRVYYRLGAERKMPFDEGAEYRDIIISSNLRNDCKVHSDKMLGESYSMQDFVSIHVARMFAVQEFIFVIQKDVDGQELAMDFFHSKVRPIAPEYQWLLEQLPLKFDPLMSPRRAPKPSR